MSRTHSIREADREIIDAHRKTNKDKLVKKRLYAVKLRWQGKSNKAISEVLETSAEVVSVWVSAYAKGGVDALLRSTFRKHFWKYFYLNRGTFISFMPRTFMDFYDFYDFYARSFMLASFGKMRYN